MDGVTWLVVAGALIVIAFVVIAVVREILEPRTGIVTEKKFQPAYTTLSCSGTGAQHHCYPVWHAECYYVRYRGNGNGNGDDYGDICATALEYDRIRVGSYWPPE